MRGRKPKQRKESGNITHLMADLIAGDFGEKEQKTYVCAFCLAVIELYSGYFIQRWISSKK